MSGYREHKGSHILWDWNYNQLLAAMWYWESNLAILQEQLSTESDSTFPYM